LAWGEDVAIRKATVRVLPFLAVAILLLCLVVDEVFCPEGVVYYLPFEYGATFTVTQGNEDSPTHNDVWTKYAFDFDLPEGTPIVASADGVVSFVKQDVDKQTGRWEDNNLIAIQHSDGNVSEYCHLKKDGAVVKEGQKVMRGDLIGYSGNTGNSLSPHLHFGLRRGHHYSGESVPCKFADVGGNGVPKKGDKVTSKNFPTRFQNEYDALERFVWLYTLCCELSCLEPALSGWDSFCKIKMDMPLSVPKDALKQRDEIVEAYKQAAVVALRALENARKADDLKTAVRIAYFGEKDFAKAEQRVEFSKALAELKKDAGYKEALAAIESEIKYREIAANVIKEELKLFEKKRKGQKVNYSSVIEGYQKALSVAPFGVVADNLKKHIESLKKGE